LTGVRVDGVVLQQNKAEWIGLYAIARSGLKDKYKLLVQKTRSYRFALQVMLSEFNIEAEVNQPSQPANFRTLIGVWVDRVVLQQNKAELIALYAIARSGLNDKYKLLVKKTRSYRFALQIMLSEFNVERM